MKLCAGLRSLLLAVAPCAGAGIETLTVVEISNRPLAKIK